MDFPCPGESPAARRPPAGDTTGSAAPGNHGFRVPFPLHGRHRCDGLTATGRIRAALKPLRERGDFTPEHTRSVLTGLGYPAGKVRACRARAVVLVPAAGRRRSACAAPARGHPRSRTPPAPGSGTDTVLA